MGKRTGKVKWFNNKKGYGFIIADDGTEFFVHYSCIQNEGYKTLKENQCVEFVVGQGVHGPQAEQVTPV